MHRNHQNNLIIIIIIIIHYFCEIEKKNKCEILKTKSKTLFILCFFLKKNSLATHSLIAYDKIDYQIIQN